MAHDRPGERATRPASEPNRTAVSAIPDGTRVRGRRYQWDAVQANNALEYPDPRLPTYEGLSEWVEGVLSRERVRSPLLPSIAYEKVRVGGVEVDEDTIRPGPARPGADRGKGRRDPWHTSPTG